jgi:hypothetical protein
VSAFDVVVIGAGAAGMMCAAVAGARGKRVLLIDHYHKLGEKIRISGGGRCNFTNIHTKPENFLSQNPDFCRSALARYTPQDFIKLVEKYGIKYHEKTLGQLFCDNSATEIIQMLKTECDRAKVQWRIPCAVKGVTKVSDQYAVSTENGSITAPVLVIATGGLAVPKIGATPFGYQLAEQFGMNIVPPRPALVPLSFDPQTLERFGDLSGLSLDAEVICNGGRFREAVLLTHRGISGPAILQISSYWQDGPAKNPIHIDLVPSTQHVSWLHEQRASKAQFNNVLGEILPKRFAQAWSNAHALTKPNNQFTDKAYTEAIAALNDWQVKPSGTLGYNKAEVTLGGVDTRQLSSKTMESTTSKRLYFIGEVVDVTGHLGGFNFQWAWASAVAAGNAL